MSLSNKIKVEIDHNGFISVEKFMTMCLFDHEYGYYIKANPIGKDGDFITAPEVSQLFGEIIALYIVNQIETFLSNTSKIQIVELGAGKGTLMLDILNVVEKFPHIYNKIEVLIVDISQTLVISQKQALKAHLPKISWAKDLKGMKPKTSIILANEFFDAIPISQYEMRFGKWLERVIKINENEDFYFDLEESKNSKKINLEKKDLKDGSIFEVNNDSVAIMHQICTHIRNYKGLFITFDYGYLESAFNDTLQSLRKHKFNEVFKGLGKADLTSYVDFGSLVRCAKENQLDDVYYMTQAKFLEAMGIKERARTLKKVSNDADIERDVRRLIDKNEMGEIFKCLIVENLK